jgi:hypothetical protein
MLRHEVLLDIKQRTLLVRLGARTVTIVDSILNHASTVAGSRVKPIRHRNAQFLERTCEFPSALLLPRSIASIRCDEPRRPQCAIGSAPCRKRAVTNALRDEACRLASATRRSAPSNKRAVTRAWFAPQQVPDAPHLPVGAPSPDHMRANASNSRLTHLAD